MSRILMAWELGGGLGHSVPLSQIAAALLDGGHEVHIALRDLSTAHGAFGTLARRPGLHLWQAPLWLPTLRGLPEAATYAELLYRAGYLDPTRLLGLVRAWRSLYETLRPDCLLVDHAPTALLAARGLPFAKATMGTGFFQPPRQRPIPPFRIWERIDPRRVEQAEDKVLATINTVLDALGQGPLGALSQLVEVDENFLLTWREVDHFSARAADPATHYWGLLPTASHGEPAQWPEGEMPKVFAYLKGEYGPVEGVLRGLREASVRTVAYVPQLPPEVAKRVASARLQLSPKPLDMASVCAQADAVVCNAGSGTVCTVLQAGIPVVLLPMHAEQLLFSIRVAESGAGAWLTETDAREKTGRTLNRLLREPGFRDAARALSEKYRPDRERNVAVEVAARITELAQRRAGSL